MTDQNNTWTWRIKSIFSIESEKGEDEEGKL